MNDYIQIADDPTLQDTMPTMPFGKHRGVPLDKIPRGYLRWVLAECDLSPSLREDIAAIVKGEPLPKSLDERVAEFMAAKYGRRESTAC
jgi:hypothetical protein